MHYRAHKTLWLNISRKLWQIESELTRRHPLTIYTQIVVLRIILIIMITNSWFGIRKAYLSKTTQSPNDNKAISIFFREGFQLGLFTIIQPILMLITGCCRLYCQQIHCSKKCGFFCANKFVSPCKIFTPVQNLSAV